MSENIIEWFKKIKGKIEENPDDALLDGLIALGGSALTYMTARQIKKSVIGYRRGFISNRLEFQELSTWAGYKLNNFFQKHNFYVVDFSHTPSEIFPEACLTLYKMLKDPDIFSYSLEDFFKSPTINALFEMPEGKRIDVRIYNAKNMQLIEEVQETQISVGEFQYYLDNRKYVVEIYDMSKKEESEIIGAFSQLQIEGCIGEKLVPHIIISGEREIRLLLGIGTRSKCCDYLLIYGEPNYWNKRDLKKEIMSQKKVGSTMRILKSNIIKLIENDQKIFFLPCERKSGTAFDHGIAQLENVLDKLNVNFKSQPEYSVLLYKEERILDEKCKSEVKAFVNSSSVKYYEKKINRNASLIKDLYAEFYIKDRYTEKERMVNDKNVKINNNNSSVATFNITDFYMIIKSNEYEKRNFMNRYVKNKKWFDYGRTF